MGRGQFKWQPRTDERSAATALRSLWRESLHVCWICEQQVVRLEDASRDHVVPQRFGADDRSVRLAHKACNVARGDLSEADVVAIKTQHPRSSPRTLRYLLQALRERLGDADR